ncbi:hypothetical protein [Sphingobium yanoikuyae]|uniref:Uncharacterized protein n=1 Tax=Sphingobium yanoikuyae ATCC 51230 TaxID=883163 RepID=K9DAQ0_SPHYA|nr:hypothetical protein [Sphingobium yanoikuyae]EKU74615.1 hypothetical protein HMPREF9718_02143 [Sphingobium yanoikuyae ATCC 51230]WQE06535.1 hypothetical protein U0025_19890 [Sphingobium yanoikuyae]
MKRTIIALALLAGCSPQDSDSALVAKAKEVAADRAPDPSSAKFTDVRECDKPGMVMGRINAKNALGAYAGSAPFFYENGKAWLPEDLGMKEFMIGIDRCLGKRSGSIDDSLLNLINETDPT